MAAHLDVEAVEVGLLGGALDDHVVGKPGPGLGRQNLLDVGRLGAQVGRAQVVHEERHLVLHLRTRTGICQTSMREEYKADEHDMKVWRLRYALERVVRVRLSNAGQLAEQKGLMRKWASGT